MTVRRKATLHGMSREWIYYIWQTMIQRCENPKAANYKRYGGRGILVCPRWHDSFLAFVEDVGDRPSLDHTIDRIDNDGNYEPGNVRWATKLQQAANRCTSVRLTAFGRTEHVSEWARILGINEHVLYYRIKQGRTPEQILGTPPESRTKHKERRVLTAAEVREVRRRYVKGDGSRGLVALGRQYDVHPSTIHGIVTGKNRAEVQG